MSLISATDVAALRARTGVSILACKQALEEAGGDQEKAIEILRKKGIAQAVKKGDRAQSEGAIFIAEGAGKAAIVSLKCETDFVARNEDFIALGKNVADTLLKESEAQAVQAAENLIPGAVQKLGENISLGSLQIVDAPAIGSYVHSNRKIGVIVGVDRTGDEFQAKAKDAAMHAAAMNPLYVRPQDVAQDVLQKEREIWQEQLKKEKKPDAILEKIIAGKEKKFREENALTSQPFVKDPNQTVEQYLGGAQVTAYVRVTV